MRIHFKSFTPDIRELYKIDGIISEYGYVYIKIIKGMYGLKQESIITYNQLIDHMDSHSYYPVPFTTGMWYHQNKKNLPLCG